MRLNIENILISDVQFDDRTTVENGVLLINKQELIDHLSGDPRLDSIDVELARPGESIRIMQVGDVIEPRARLDSGAINFPGALGEMQTVGQGRTRRLEGAAVVLNDHSDPEYLVEHDNAVGILIDMSGPCVDISPYSHTQNIVIIPKPADGVSRHGYKIAMKLAGLKAAVYLAEATRNLEADTVETFELPPLTEVTRGMENLPRVIYNFQIYCTSYPAVPGEPILYGDNIQTMPPILIHPNEVLDGGIVNPYHGIGTETYIIQNHPIIRELYDRHGKDLCFAGVILTVSRYKETDRVRGVAMIADLAKSVVGAEGIVITKSSSGAPDVDVAQTAQACEDVGVKAVLLMFDRSDGSEVGAVFNQPGARAIVSTANQYQEYLLPSVQKAIGRPAKLPDGTDGMSGLNKPLRWIRGGLDQVGFQTLKPVIY